MEIWKDVKGYEGYYQVSCYGNVKSVDRNVFVKKQGYRKLPGKILAYSKSNSGYFHVVLCKNHMVKTRTIHTLVAESFLNYTPKGRGFVINHKDFNRQNNNLDNLEIVTSRDNTNQKHLKSTSKYTGVSWHKARAKWHAQITVNNRTKSLGYFITETKASESYQEALTKILNK